MIETRTDSELRYERLIESLSDIVWIIDNKGKIRYINDVAEGILGYSKSDLLEHALFEFMCPLHVYSVGSCVNVVAQMQVRDFNREEMWMLHSDGKTRKVLEVNTRRVVIGEEEFEVQGVARDITERIRLERKVKSRQKHLMLLNDVGSIISTKIFENDDYHIVDAIGKRLAQDMNLPLVLYSTLDDNGQIYPLGRFGTLSNKVKCKDCNLSALDQERLVHLESYHLIKGFWEPLQINIEADNIRESDFCTMVLPVKSEGRLNGLLVTCLPCDYDLDIEPILTSVAYQLATAVEKNRLYRQNREFYLKVISSLIAAMEAKDYYTQGHSVRVSQYAMAIGRALNLEERQIQELEIASILHDIGKIGISDAILTKGGVLTKEEFETIRQHPEIGARILEPIGFSQQILKAVRFHHKGYDHKGYPYNIPLEGDSLFVNIIGAADAYDAMTSNRSYRKMMDKEAVLMELNRCSGTQFCPEIVDKLIELINTDPVFIECFL